MLQILKIFIIINLITLMACDEDNLYQNFINEEKDFYKSLESVDGYEKKRSAYDDEEDVKYREMIHSMQALRDVNGQQHEYGSGGDMARQVNMMPASNDTTISGKSDSDLSRKFINNTSDGVEAISATNRILATLDEMREELEVMRATKMCNGTPDGINCDINGSWNSAEIGLHVEIVAARDDDKLHVNLTDKNPKKQTYRIDATWRCSGTAIHTLGGPFLFHCTSHSSPQSMAIFHGICKHCSGFDTIFGEWIFQHVPKDCRQLWTFAETKRDVFHKDVLHHGAGKLDGRDEKKANHINQSISSANITTIDRIVGNVNSKSKTRRHNTNHEQLMRKWYRD